VFVKFAMTAVCWDKMEWKFDVEVTSVSGEAGAMGLLDDEEAVAAVETPLSREDGVGVGGV
jgi:hypothetical protein